MGTGFISFEKSVLLLWSEWWIPVAVMASLTLQLLLLLTGSARRGSAVLTVVAWNAYIWSDNMATLALGGMVQNAIGSGHQIYAIWTPILLLHLGAPDNISAYALEDNELWLRHGLIMILHVLAAILVVINCAKGWHYIILSSFLMIIGSIKYAERTLALRSASKSAIEKSALPIYTFMRLEHLISFQIEAGQFTDSSDYDRYFYIINGEQEWYHHLKHHFPTWSEQNHPQAYLRAAKMTTNFVTLEDILAESLLFGSTNILHTCLAFALFKLSQRRFSGLYIFEWKEPKTRRFFLQSSGRERTIFGRNILPEVDIMLVLDLELQFITDSLYTKSTQTAFTRFGVLFRVATTILLAASVTILRVMNTELYSQDLVVKEARIITFLLVIGASLVETCQIFRLLRSNWTKVWLACTYVQLLRDQTKGFHIQYCRLCIGLILKTLTIIHARGSTSSTLQDGICKYLANKIGQYAFIDQLAMVSRDLGTYSSLQGRIRRWLEFRGLIQTQMYESDPNLVHQFKLRVLGDVLHLCRRLSDSATLEPQFGGFYQFLTVQKLLDKRPWRHNFEQYCVYIASNHMRTKGSARKIITSWHLATTVCELLDDCPAMDLSVKMAKIMSRYALYLMVQKVQLLPRHTWRRVWDTQLSLCSSLTTIAYTKYGDQYNGTELDLKLLMQTLIMQSPDLCPWHGHEDSYYAQDDDVQRVLSDICNIQRKYDSDILGKTGISYEHEEGTHLRVHEDLWPGLMSGKLLLLGISNREERWQFIWNFWIEILASLASHNNDSEHLKQLAMGGEFLTHIWLLLGHLGFNKRV